jgi:peptide deformylase
MQDDNETTTGIVNPTVTVPENTRFERMAEGCLSFPGYYGLVARATAVRVQGHRVVLSAPVMPTEFKFEPFDEIWTGHKAQLAQHEYDHLRGICYTQHLSSAERSRIHGNMRKLKAKR